MKVYPLVVSCYPALPLSVPKPMDHQQPKGNKPKVQTTCLACPMVYQLQKGEDV